tara:strand:- start:1328 stop:1516 length:189 start_codon:yes stop_codon:yes gene_type:complete
MAMTYGSIDKPSKEIKNILNVLHDLFEQTDEDCPSEYRSEHLRAALSEAEDLLIKYKLRVRS